MTDINVLYLEHDDKAFTSYTYGIKGQWKRSFNGEMSIERVVSVEEAKEKLDAEEEKYQVFISDILFPPMATPEESDKSKHVPRFDAITHASSKKKLLVIGLSAGPNQGQQRLAEDAIKNGAHRAYYIQELFPGIDIFCEEIHELLEQKGIIPDLINLDYDRDDAPLCHIIYEIGETTLRSLLKQIVPDNIEIEQIKLDYLAPGMSGAFVLQAEVQQAQRLGTTYLFKASTNRKRLSEEIKRCPDVGGAYAERLVVRYLNKVAEVEEWYAIGTGFLKNTKSFKTWLTEGHKKGEIEGVMRHLFLENGLKEGYGVDRNNQKQPKRAVEALRPNLSRQARIQQAVEELGEVVAAESLGGINNWDTKANLILRYLRSLQIGTRDAKSTPKNCFMCQCHGDLHSRNILVTTNNPAIPIIIDWADFDICHWAADCARLLADMVLAIYDNGISSYEWTHLSQWCTIANSIIEGVKLPLEEDPTNKSVVYAINWIIENIEEICLATNCDGGRESWLWELQLALAVEFMRGAYRPDLTEPKRVLGLIVAANAISCAEQNTPTI